MPNIKSIGQGFRGLRLPKIGGFLLTLNVALTTVLRTNVLHCDTIYSILLKDSHSRNVPLILGPLAIAESLVIVLFLSQHNITLRMLWA